jgi:tetratricopeptide (TPR) repeat protein
MDGYENKYFLSNSDLIIYVPNMYNNAFGKYFLPKGFIQIKNNICILTYDNLINLCIMVKNGGPQFEQMLTDNLPIIDRWTILDTGSTDDTINIINKVLVGKKHGNLYQEPFINFRESRNRLLDLAGTSCKYNIMLDDTYVVQGDLRGFLTEVRGDQYANSFTLYIKSDDTQYGSNRIIKSNSGLRYIHTIHEVITDKNNINVVIPQSKAMVDDRRFDYMEKRTQERKQLDLKLLYEEVEENPNDPRAYYYLAQTYNLLEDYENAYKYFLKRAEFTNSGFIQERIDAVFEAARVANFKLKYSWDKCEELYNKAFKIDESRPETQYFIGIHYYLENNMILAYKYFKKSFEIGFPLHCQYSLKPTLSFHFLPKFLARTCYQPCIEDFKLGEEASIFFLQNNKSTDNDYEEIVSWYKIFNKLNSFNPNTDKIVTIKSDKPFFVYIADGGFNQWTGSTILEKGVGGSETYIIEMARYIQQSNKFQTVVFCNTPNNLEEFFEDVIYKPLTEYASFIKNNKVHTCFISRFSEYLPLTYKGLVENIYLVLHDLTASGNVIPIEPSLKRIFCLSEWHAEYYSNIMPDLKHLITPFYYGIDTKKFINNNIEKIPYKFIYSSFPNRGLLPLLQMWKQIVEIQPLAQLHIYSDINGKWVNEVAPEQIKEIKLLLDFYNYDNNNKSDKYNIFLHGWVSKAKLAEAWQSSDIWFYPCTFMETFCLTALEAAITNTLVVTNDLAALQNTVGNRGIIINGDPMTKEWQEKTISILTPFLQNNIINNELKEQLINTNYNWAKNLTWKNRATKMLDEYIYPTLITNNNLDFEWLNYFCFLFVYMLYQTCFRYFHLFFC